MENYEWIEKHLNCISKYGISFLWNNLRLEDNMYHVVNGNKTDLVIHPENLSENRLRHVQMNFPYILSGIFLEMESILMGLKETEQINLYD